jgi:hypothetical protein
VTQSQYIQALKHANAAIQRQSAKVAELEKVLSKFEHSVRNENELLEMQKNQDIRELEQQAKGIEDAVTKLERPDVPLAPYYILNNDLLDCAGVLKSQSKALKETK